MNRRIENMYYVHELKHMKEKEKGAEKKPQIKQKRLKHFDVSRSAAVSDGW